MKKFILINIFLLLSNFCLAQNYSGSTTSLGGGIALGSESGRGTGYDLFFNYGHVVNKNFGFSFELAYHQVSFSSETKLTSPFNRIITTEGDDHGVSLKFECMIGKFNDERRYLYYGIVGLGYDISGTSGETKIDGQLLNNESSESSWAVGPYYNAVLVLGSGVGYRISRKAAFTLEVKMENIENYNYYPIRLGLTFLPAISE